MVKIAHRKHAKKVKILALLSAATIFASGWTLSSCSHKYDDPKAAFLPLDGGSEILLEEEEQVQEEITAAVNDYQEIKGKLIHIMEDAASKGMYDISVDQWFDWYITMNIQEISASEFAKFYDDRYTESMILNNTDIVNNNLLVNTIVSRPDTFVEISELIYDEKTKETVREFQLLFAEFNAADRSNKPALAENINQKLYDLYATGKFKEITPSGNILIISLAEAMLNLTINDSFRIPTKPISEIIFADMKSCSLVDKTDANSLYHDEKTLLLQMLNEKLALMREYAKERELVSQRDKLLAAVMDEAIIVKVEAPSFEEEIMKTKPPMTETVRTTPAATSSSGQQPKTAQEIDQTNREADHRAQGMKDGYEAGNRHAFADTSGSASSAFPSKNPNSYSSQYANNNAYVSAYREAYERGYSETIVERARVLGRHDGINFGVRLVEQGSGYRTISSIENSNYTRFNGTIFASPYISAFNTASRVSYDEAKRAYEEAKKAHGDDVSPPKVIEESPTESTTLQPGFDTDGDYIVDPDGNVVKDEHGNPIKINSSNSSSAPASTSSTPPPQPSAPTPQEDIYDEKEDVTIITPDFDGPIYDEDGNVIELNSKKIR